MDSQTPISSVPSSIPDAKKRRMVAVAFVLCAAVVVGWLLYQNFGSSNSSIYEERAVIIDQIANESIQYGETTNVTKRPILDQIQKESTVPSQKKATPENTVTLEEKQSVIDSIMSSSSQ